MLTNVRTGETITDDELRQVVQLARDARDYPTAADARIALGELSHYSDAFRAECRERAARFWNSHTTGLSSRAYTIRLATGELVTGPVHGSGGVVGHGQGNADRIRRAIRRANKGESTGLYEPQPGHARMYPAYSANDSGEPRDVDLRGAELVS